MPASTLPEGLQPPVVIKLVCKLLQVICCAVFQPRCVPLRAICAARPRLRSLCFVYRRLVAQLDLRGVSYSLKCMVHDMYVYLPTRVLPCKAVYAGFAESRRIAVQYVHTWMSSHSVVVPSFSLYVV